MGLDIDVLKTVEQNYIYKVENCFQETLLKWLKSTLNATWKALELAITNVRRQQLGLGPVDDVYGEDVCVAI